MIDPDFLITTEELTLKFTHPQGCYALSFQSANLSFDQFAFHYGSLDVPGPENFSASYNETVLPAINEVKTIYAAVGAESNVHFMVTAGKGHEMDIDAVVEFLAI